MENDKFYSEARHIRPLGNNHNGPDIEENIIVVYPNHHALLDYGAIPILLNNLTIHEEHSISQKFVDYHNQMIYKDNV